MGRGFILIFYSYSNIRNVTVNLHGTWFYSYIRNVAVFSNSKSNSTYDILFIFLNSIQRCLTLILFLGIFSNILDTNSNWAVIFYLCRSDFETTEIALYIFVLSEMAKYKEEQNKGNTHLERRKQRGDIVKRK